MKIQDFLEHTDERHSDMVDAMAYSIAAQMYKFRDEYCLLYIKAKPKWLPERLYRWVLNKVLVLAEFTN